MRQQETETTNKERKFWRVPVTITSYIYEGGYRFYEADSADEALAKFNDDDEDSLYEDTDGSYDTDWISEKVESENDIEEATPEEIELFKEDLA
mgnify:CR=1 FL=1